MAIECDGAGYHSSLVARTRDRARQRMLEKLGWRFYRVWSTNWWFFEQQEKESLIAAIDSARLNDAPSGKTHRINPASTNKEEIIEKPKNDNQKNFTDAKIMEFIKANNLKIKDERRGGGCLLVYCENSGNISGQLREMGFLEHRKIKDCFYLQ